MGKGGRQGDKEGRTRGRQFLSATSEARSPLISCWNRDQVRPLRVQLNRLLQKEQFSGGERRTHPAAERNTGALSVFSTSDFIGEERGLWLRSWGRLLLMTCHTQQQWRNISQRLYVKSPSKPPGSGEMLGSIILLLAFLGKSPILSRHCQPSNRRDLLLNLHLTPPPLPELPNRIRFGERTAEGGRGGGGRLDL